MALRSRRRVLVPALLLALAALIAVFSDVKAPETLQAWTLLAGFDIIRFGIRDQGKKLSCKCMSHCLMFAVIVRYIDRVVI